MNTRPLFWAVMCFALGEVIYIVADKGSKISTTFVVLIFGVIIISRTRLSWKKKILYPLMFVIGVCRILWADYTYLGDELFGKGEYKECFREYDGYKVSYVDNEAYVAKRYVDVAAVGLVDNVSLGASGYSVTVMMTYFEAENLAVEGTCKVIIYSVDDELVIGDRVSLEGRIYDFVPSLNPGEFNRKNYYKSRGIVGYGTADEIELSRIDEEKNIEVSGADCLEQMRYGLKRKLYYAKTRFIEALGLICCGDSKELFSAILLGEKGGIPDEDMLLYRISGIAHIFAISGLHIGIVGGLLYKLSRKAGLKFVPAAALAMVVTILYGIMTGFSFSTIRAIVMLGLSLGGEVLGRRYDMLTGMGLALAVLLMVEPYRILDGGLILSFGAVSGVVVSKYIIKLLEKNKKFSKLQKKKYRWIYGLISAFIFSVGISVVSTPLVAYMYYQIPIYSVLLNMIIVPLMSVTVFSGFFGVLVGMISPMLGEIIIFPGVLSLKLYKLCCRGLQMLPCGVINTGKINIYELILYYVVLAIILIGVNSEITSHIRKIIYDRTKKWVPYMRIRFVSYIVMVAAVVCFVVGVICLRNMTTVGQITFLDVGQGDGVLINTRSGINIVVDVGSSSNKSVGKYVAYPAILTEHKGRVDYWFISHFDSDHTSGLEYIINSPIDMGISIENLVVSKSGAESGESLLQAAKDQGINIIYMEAGDYMVGEDFSIKAIHPAKNFDSEDENEQSLVLSYEADDFKLLLTGDIGEDTIMHMLDIGILDSDYDALKVPHHGSKYSYSMKFIESINTEVAVISCGIKNSYGHPHKDMVQGLYDGGNDVYRTDYQGRILIIVD